MKIKYKKKLLKQYLFFAILWSVLGLLNLKYSDGNNWFLYGYFILAILYCFAYFYEKRNPYLIVDNKSIKKNFPFGKKINLSEVIWIKKFAGEYILKTEKDEMTINTEVIDENSLTELNRLLEKLNLPPDKTPFANNA